MLSKGAPSLPGGHRPLLQVPLPRGPEARELQQMLRQRRSWRRPRGDRDPPGARGHQGPLREGRPAQQVSAFAAAQHGHCLPL